MRRRPATQTQGTGTITGVTFALAALGDTTGNSANYWPTHSCSPVSVDGVLIRVGASPYEVNRLKTGEQFVQGANGMWVLNRKHFAIKLLPNRRGDIISVTVQAAP
jgi:hypothetical protein